VGDKTKKIYEALLEGAESGLTDKALYKHVVDECPKATSKKIVKASLLALSDDEVKDAQILKVIYDLAIKHRLDPHSAEDVEEPAIDKMPKLKKGRASGKKEEAAETAG
jgi:hypothetical protein